MTSLFDALRWDGVYVRVQIYAAFARAPFELVFHGPECLGLSRKPLVSWLDDEFCTVAGSLCVLDLTLDEVPADMHSCFRLALEVVAEMGAKYAWLQFDGGFEFSQLLSSEAAEEIYGLMSEGKIDLALEECVRRSDEWKSLIEGVRQNLVAP